MGLDYVDIFYSHRFDPDTPLEETMGALDTAVRQGKALYAGISSYSGERTREAARILRELGTPLLIHQPSLLAAQPLDRGGPARRARRGGRRLHRLLAARAGHAHRQVPRRRARGLARRRGRLRSATDMLTEETPRARARAQRDRAAARPDAGADGDRVGAARPARDLGADRRLERRAARATTSARSTTSTSPTTSCAEIDRHAVEARHQPLGGVQRRLGCDLVGLHDDELETRRGPRGCA